MLKKLQTFFMAGSSYSSTVKKLSIFLLLIISLFTINLSNAYATNLWGNQQNNIQNATGLGNNDPRQMVAEIVNVILGFLGIIALILILYAGFLWMTAAGDDSKIKKAKDLLLAAVIGLIIILMAFAIASFVLNEVSNATNLSNT